MKGRGFSDLSSQPLANMMMLLLRPKLKEGWLSVAFAPDRIDFAHMRRRRGKKPEFLLLSTYQRAGNDVEALTSLRKVFAE